MAPGTGGGQAVGSDHEERLQHSTHSHLRAEPGDRLVIRGHDLGEPQRDAEIIEVLGEDGAPPYVVRWEDDGHISRLYPSSDAYVDHLDEDR